MGGKPLLLTLVLLLSVTSVSAGTVSLKTSVIVTKSGADVEIIVNIENTGDSIAQNVKVSADFWGETFQFTAQDILAGGKESFRPAGELLFLDDKKLVPGDYPVAVWFSYSDDTLTSFAHAAYGILRTVELPAEDTVQVSLEKAELRQAAEFYVELKNTSLTPRTYAVSVHTTQDVTVEPPSNAVSLDPDQSQQLTFRLTNIAGHEQTVTPMFVFVENETDLHRTMVMETPLAIIENAVVRAKERRTAVTYIAVGAALLLVLSGYLYTRFFVNRATNQ